MFTIDNIFPCGLTTKHFLYSVSESVLDRTTYLNHTLISKCLIFKFFIKLENDILCITQDTANTVSVVCIISILQNKQQWSSIFLPCSNGVFTSIKHDQMVIDCMIFDAIFLLLLSHDCSILNNDTCIFR